MVFALTRRTMLGCGLGALCAPYAWSQERLGDAEFTRAANLAVDRAASEDGFSGVILVARGLQVLLRRAAGFGDRERQIRNTPETKFNLESVTKQFTAAAIMVLVENDRVGLDDPISKFYPTSPPAWKGVTVKHLLTHSSGISDYWVRRPFENYPESQISEFGSPEGLIQRSLKDPLAFAPGTRFQYSNVGYALLTAVIERASGVDYGAFLQSRIFDPLDMSHTGYGGILPMNGYRHSTAASAARDALISTGPQNLGALG